MSRALTPERTAERAAWATFAVFTLNGLVFANWVSRLPAVRDALELTPARLGFLLLIGSVGSIIALPLTGAIVQRLGTRRTVVLAATANVALLGLVAVAVGLGEVALLAPALFVAQMGIAAWDVAMNIEGASVEQALRRAIMPRFHAGFSLGTVVGAGMGALAALAGISVTVHLLVVLGLILLAVLACVRWFLPETGGLGSAPAGHHGGHHDGEHGEHGGHGGHHDGVHRPDGGHVHDGAHGDAHAPKRRRSSFAAWGERRTLLVGLVVLAAALTEGSANDWLALAVVDGFGTTDAVGAAAFGVFVAAMTLMRLVGTEMLDRYGRVPVLRLCTALALVGLLVFTVSPVMWLAMVGAVLWGLGAALGFPVGMSAASDDPVHAAGRVSVVSSIGYTAFLAGPPLLGLLAEQVGYRQALLAIAVPLLLSLFVLPAARPIGAVATEERAAAAGERP